MIIELQANGDRCIVEVNDHAHAMEVSKGVAAKLGVAVSWRNTVTEPIWCPMCDCRTVNTCRHSKCISCCRMCGDCKHTNPHPSLEV